jgi:Transposase DNA-binding/Transposase DDE domain
MIASPRSESFGEALFGHAQLGDQRRAARLVDLTDQLCRHPGGTLPEKLHSPKDLKALYRLCACDAVTHEALMQSVRQAVLAECNHHSVVLIIQDSTELDYSTHKSLAEQLGQVGRRRGKHGYICHSSLAVTAEGRQVIGLVNQYLHRRVHVPKQETLAEKRDRPSRESRLWLRGTEGLPAERRFVDIGDQGADTFEFLEHETHSGRRFVVRVHKPRKVNAGHKPVKSHRSLQEFARALPAIGGRITQVQAQARYGRNPARPARFAQLSISATAVLVHPPHAKHGAHGDEPLPLWLVRVWEANPPQGAKPIEWLLLTNEPVATLDDAQRVIGWYQTRWVIEEFHKALKTGCRVETLQFTATARLEPMIALLSTVATTLLNLRAASQLPDAKTRRATTVVDRAYVELLSQWRSGRVKALTVHEFYFALARLGGHQNRRCDKRPGWMILWRGWTALQTMMDGARIIQRKCG